MYPPSGPWFSEGRIIWGRPLRKPHVFPARCRLAPSRSIRLSHQEGTGPSAIALRGGWARPHAAAGASKVAPPPLRPLPTTAERLPLLSLAQPQTDQSMRPFHRSTHQNPMAPTLQSPNFIDPPSSTPFCHLKKIVVLLPREKTSHPCKTSGEFWVSICFPLF